MAVICADGLRDAITVLEVKLAEAEAVRDAARKRAHELAIPPVPSFPAVRPYLARHGARESSCRNALPTATPSRARPYKSLESLERRAQAGRGRAEIG
jgi:hypothetical protein